MRIITKNTSPFIAGCLLAMVSCAAPLEKPNFGKSGALDGQVGDPNEGDPSGKDPSDPNTGDPSDPSKPGAGGTGGTDEPDIGKLDPNLPGEKPVNTGKKPDGSWVEPELTKPSSIVIPADRGYQNKPWESIQAEDSIIGGAAVKLAPTRRKWDKNFIQAEAIGRSAVRLSKTGDSVTFKPTKAGNSIVVRLSIPDSPNGGGIDSTISVYIAGKKVKSLPVTSRYSWSYDGERLGVKAVDDPRIKATEPHTFFDDARSLLPEYAAGTEIMLRKDAEDTAEFYVIDLADFEKVAPPLEMPAGFVSIETVAPGVKPNDGKDHADEIARAIMTTPKLWFPPGEYIATKFSSMNEGMDNPGNEIRGAGMWHTMLRGRRMILFCNGAVSCKYRDFSLFGETKARAEEEEGVQKAFAGSLGVNSTIDNVWVEHVVAAIWVGNDPPYQNQPTEGLKINNVRLRNIYADGINFANGTSNSTATNVHVRNAGDDGIALWSIKWTDWVREKGFQAGEDFIKGDGKNAPDQGQNKNNTFQNLTVEGIWRANCFASYGGQNNKWLNGVCQDVLTYPGILVANQYSSYDYGPATTFFKDLHVIRAGGTMFHENTKDQWDHGALKFYQAEGTVNDVTAENIDIIDPLFSGIEFKGFGTNYIISDKNGVPQKWEPGLLRNSDAAAFKNILLKNITVTNAGKYGVEVGAAGGRGVVSFENVKVGKTVNGGLGTKETVPASFYDKKAGNSGW